MSAPATVSSTQPSALQGLHQRATQATHGTGSAAQPSQLQISFANLISTMQAGSSAASQTPAITQVGATSGAAGAVSGSASTDLASLIESLLANNGSAAADNFLQTATAPQDTAKSQLGQHHHHHVAAQVSGASNPGSSSNSATSAYTAMQSQTTATVGVSAQA